MQNRTLTRHNHKSLHLWKRLFGGQQVEFSDSVCEQRLKLKNERKRKEGHYTSNTTEKIMDHSCKIQFVSSILLHDQGDRTTPITLWAHFEHTQRSPRQLNTLYGYHTWDCVRMKTIQNSPNAKSAVFSLKNFSAPSKTYIFQISNICNTVGNIKNTQRMIMTLALEW